MKQFTSRLFITLIALTPISVPFTNNALAETENHKATTNPANPAEHSDQLPGLANVGTIAPGIYRGAAPEKNGYATLKRMGIKTVIDMRTTDNEQADVEGAGMRAISVPIKMTRKGLKEKVEQVMTLMADPANQPVYIHCRHGQDRTGIVSAAYRMKYQGWSLRDAKKEMQTFGFNNIWVNFNSFITKYGKDLQRQNRLSKR